MNVLALSRSPDVQVKSLEQAVCDANLRETYVKLEMQHRRPGDMDGLICYGDTKVPEQWRDRTILERLQETWRDFGPSRKTMQSVLVAALCLTGGQAAYQTPASEERPPAPLAVWRPADLNLPVCRPQDRPPAPVAVWTRPVSFELPEVNSTTTPLAIWEPSATNEEPAVTMTAGRQFGILERADFLARGVVSLATTALGSLFIAGTLQE